MSIARSDLTAAIGQSPTLTTGEVCFCAGVTAFNRAMIRRSIALVFPNAHNDLSLPGFQPCLCLGIV